MKENYLLSAVRYVELNPVLARFVKDPSTYPWISARNHIFGKDDELVRVKSLLEFVPNWNNFLEEGNRREGYKDPKAA